MKNSGRTVGPERPLPSNSRGRKLRSETLICFIMRRIFLNPEPDLTDLGRHWKTSRIIPSAEEK